MEEKYIVITRTGAVVNAHGMPCGPGTKTYEEREGVSFNEAHRRIDLYFYSNPLTDASVIPVKVNTNLRYTSYMANTKKTTLTPDQADELEGLITDYLQPDGFGNPLRDITDLLREVAAPKDVKAALKMRLESLVEDFKFLEGECTRGNAETVAEGCKHLDEYLGKRFNVKMPGRRTFKWSVG